MEGVHRREMEGVHRRVVLLSAAPSALAATPLAKQPSAYGQPPKRLRRWRYGALLLARLDRHPAAVQWRRRGGASPRARRVCNAACQLRWQSIFGNEQPVALEVGAGDGGWALAQARAAPAWNWVACELRGNRIHQMVARLRAVRAPNLAVLGADAAIALREHTHPRTFAAIYGAAEALYPQHTQSEPIVQTRDRHRGCGGDFALLPLAEWRLLLYYRYRFKLLQLAVLLLTP